MYIEYRSQMLTGVWPKFVPGRNRSSVTENDYLRNLGGGKWGRRNVVHHIKGILDGLTEGNFF